MGLTFTIKAAPRARRQRWALDASGMIKCYLTSPPEKGKANRELIKLLAQACNIPPSMINITHGLTHQVKTIHIPLDITYQKLLQLLQLDRQLSIDE